MKLLIADDDRQIREGIREGIDWSEIGIADVLLASDSREALTLFAEAEPDIVITDIRMPGMDGLELLSRIRRIRPATKVIILSAYNDFDYMKRAMQYGASDYEVKPIRARSLINLIKKMRDEIVKDRVTEEAYRKYKIAYRDSFIRNWLNGTVRDRLVILEELAQCSFDAKGGMFCAVLEPQYREVRLERLRALGDELEAALEEMRQDAPWLLHRADDRLVLVMKAQHSMLYFQQTKSRLQRILKRVAADGGCAPFAAGFSGLGNAAEIQRLYAEAEAAMERQFYADGEAGMPVGSPPAGAPVPLERGPVVSLLDRAKLRQAVREGDEAAVQALLGAEFDRLASEARYCRESVATFCQTLLDMLAECSAPADATARRKAELSGGSAPVSFKACHRLVMEAYAETTRSCRAERRSQLGSMMRRIGDYIERHYREELTVELLAEQAGITPNYFSHLFKKEFGIAFKEHVNRLRVNRAKELLESTNLLVYEIGQRVGYANYAYFIQVFKKLEGYSPSELRKKAAIEEKLNNL
ncbi:response regulator transcription factor [Cohnella zeiphila]|uniref:Response regulator transcription factor n=1 Tax=Cohnella zeiphila TaxID=2761120 RepID=A0A7X0SQK6_9BACL|nr:response regulator [Cohnella zeiphila]MBB6732093.1 response regulator transcription factor [Cohnella zeiphila]